MRTLSDVVGGFRADEGVGGLFMFLWFFFVLLLSAPCWFLLLCDLHDVLLVLCGLADDLSVASLDGFDKDGFLGVDFRRALLTVGLRTGLSEADGGVG